MKIAIFVPYLQGGGVGKMMSRVALHLREHGYDVDLVVGSLRKQEVFPDPNKARIIDLRAERFIPMFLRFFHYRVTQKPELIFTATSLPNMVAVLTTILGFFPRSSTIISEREVRGPVMGWNASLRSRIFRELSRFCYRRANKIIAVSHGVRDMLISRAGLRGDQIRVVYNPVVDDSIVTKSTEPVNEPWLADKSVPVVLAVGRLSREKGFDTLIEAMCILNTRRECRLVILGEGKLREELAALVSAKGMDALVRFLGFRENPYAYMSKANVFVLPSVHEGFGNVLVEALACGAPVVSTDCPSGPSEILEEGKYGPLVPVGDANAMAAAIEKQLTTPKPAELLRQRAQKFSAEAAFEAYRKLAQAGLQT